MVEGRGGGTGESSKVCCAPGLVAAEGQIGLEGAVMPEVQYGRKLNENIKNSFIYRVTLKEIDTFNVALKRNY